MRLDHDSLRFSPTDLANFSSCGQRSLLDRLRAHGRASAPTFDDPLLEQLKQKGIEHEERYLQTLRAGAASAFAAVGGAATAPNAARIVEFPGLTREQRTPENYQRRADETRAAMAAGAEVIYQGTLYDGVWLGLVDFLIKVDSPSDLGDWSYEVVDAKLAREAKATAVLQCCVYSDLLEPVQGRAPDHIHLYLGGPKPRRESFRLAHFAAYYRALKRRFLVHVGAAPDHPEVALDHPEVAPDPVDFCRICDWQQRCRNERKAVDHLSLVAGIGRDHRRALEAWGVTTLESLAELPLEPTPDGLRATGFQRIREQARVQLEGRRRGGPYYELLRPDAPDAPDAASHAARPEGLAALPEPSPHDWFFDFESASLAGDDGLEYLWGVTDAHDVYRADWAYTPAEERAVLERFLTEAFAHIEAHPDAHIYHFGHKEPSTLKRLVGRYGVGTDELDALLTREAFVDLHRIVKQGLVASVERYSLKPLEKLCGFERTIDLRDANRARGALEAGLAQGLGAEALGEAMYRRPGSEKSDRGGGAPVLMTVQGYNEDDCVATRVLRDWLEARRSELESQVGHAIHRPTPKEPEADTTEDDSDIAAEVRRLMEGLLSGVPENHDDRTPAQHVRWLMAHLIEWHRREDKSAYWDYFRLKELTSDELMEETQPLAGLEYEGAVDTVKRSTVHRYRFPPQEHRIKRKAVDPAYEKRKGWKVHAIDELEGTVDLLVGNRTGAEVMARVEALLPDEIVQAGLQKARGRETAARLLEGEDALREWSPASLALLRAEPPRFSGDYRLPRDRAAELNVIEHATTAVRTLDAGVLPVQGPPGTGKTFSGARMIRALLRDGRRVGVIAGSHKVIENLLAAVCSADDEGDPPTDIRGLQVTSREGCQDPRFTKVKSASGVPDAVPEGRAADEGGPIGLEAFNLFAGTAWLWSAEHMVGSVDVLFIDEAGQFSLANALAVAPAARSLVLLGDPQQLNQPQKGVHPPGAEVSVLEHLAGEDGIITPEQGLFLGETWRMRPEITAFTSELFYQDELDHEPDNERQQLSLADGRLVHGLFHVPVRHEGNSRSSIEEADAVVGLYRTLLADGSTFTSRDGTTRPLAAADLLVVAPYNAQVDRIRQALGAAGFEGAHVGTVDKFQGQEAAVAIYSLASSSAYDAPRGMDFLYAPDRLNVATSRARCATIVVSSPELFTAECKRPAQMRMVNALVRYGEMGRGLV